MQYGLFIYLTSLLCPPPSLPAWIWQVGDVRSLFPGQQIPFEDQRLSQPKDV